MYYCQIGQISEPQASSGIDARVLLIPTRLKKRKVLSRISELMEYSYIPEQIVAFELVLQRGLRLKARVALSLNPRLGSFLSLTRMQRQKLDLSTSLCSSVQHAGEGAMASPVTKLGHEDRLTNCCWHTFLSCAKSKLERQNIISIIKLMAKTFPAIADMYVFYVFCLVFHTHAAALITYLYQFLEKDLSHFLVMRLVSYGVNGSKWHVISEIDVPLKNTIFSIIATLHKILYRTKSASFCRLYNSFHTVKVLGRKRGTQAKG